MKKTIVMALAIALVLCMTVGGTLAWLMDTTPAVTNTFEAGNVEITLKESPYNKADNTYSAPAEGVSNSYPMIPGTTYKKDPTVAVVEGSEACYLFVKIEEKNNAKTYLGYELNLTGWTQLDGVAGVYYRVVEKNADERSWNLLTGDTITVNGEAVTKENMDEAVNAELVFTAYAVQKANVTDAAAAWAIANPASGN